MYSEVAAQAGNVPTLIKLGASAVWVHWRDVLEGGDESAIEELGLSYDMEWYLQHDFHVCDTCKRKYLHNRYNARQSALTFCSWACYEAKRNRVRRAISVLGQRH